MPLTWLLLDIQLMVDLIANKKMLVNIRTVRGKDAIHAHCNSGAKILNRVGEPPGHRNVWYKLTGITNIILMSRATKKFQVFF